MRKTLLLIDFSETVHSKQGKADNLQFVVVAGTRYQNFRINDFAGDLINLTWNKIVYRQSNQLKNSFRGIFIFGLRTKKNVSRFTSFGDPTNKKKSNEKKNKACPYLQNASPATWGHSSSQPDKHKSHTKCTEPSFFSACFFFSYQNCDKINIFYAIEYAHSLK